MSLPLREAFKKFISNCESLKIVDKPFEFKFSERTHASVLKVLEKKVEEFGREKASGVERVTQMY